MACTYVRFSFFLMLSTINFILLHFMNFCKISPIFCRMRWHINKILKYFYHSVCLYLLTIETMTPGSRTTFLGEYVGLCSFWVVAGAQWMQADWGMKGWAYDSHQNPLLYLPFAFSVSTRQSVTSLVGECPCVCTYILLSTVNNSPRLTIKLT